MSTSLLYHAFGIREYNYVRTQYHTGNIIFTIEKKKLSNRCPCCKCKDVIRHGTIVRWFHSLPIGNKATYRITSVPRVECKRCHITRQVNIGFADHRVTYTRALERYALALSKHMTILDVAIHLGLSWDTVKGMQKRYLKKRYKNLKLKDLKLIAVDEIKRKKKVNIKAVAMDMSPAYIKAMTENLPDAKIVFAHFHVIKL